MFVWRTERANLGRVGCDAGALAGQRGALRLGAVVRGLGDGGRRAGAGEAPAMVGALQRAVGSALCAPARAAPACTHTASQF